MDDEHTPLQRPIASEDASDGLGGQGGSVEGSLPPREQGWNHLTENFVALERRNSELRETAIELRSTSAAARGRSRALCTEASALKRPWRRFRDLLGAPAKPQRRG